MMTSGRRSVPVLPLDLPFKLGHNETYPETYLNLVFNLLPLPFPVPHTHDDEFFLGPDWSRFTNWAGDGVVAMADTIEDSIISHASYPLQLLKTLEPTSIGHPLVLHRMDSKSESGSEYSESEMESEFDRSEKMAVGLTLRFITRGFIRRYIIENVCHDKATGRQCSILFLVPRFIKSGMIPRAMVQFLFLRDEALSQFPYYEIKINELFDCLPDQSLKAE